jgi:hypothetical protein
MSMRNRFVNRRRMLFAAGATAVASRKLLAAGGKLVIDFATAPIGQLPPGFTIAKTGQGTASAWSVQEDGSVAGGKVLTQISTDATDYRFPLAIYDKISAANLDVSVRFKAVAGRIDRAGGLAIRLIDPDNYYVVRANALEDNVNFYRVVKGSRRQIAGASTKVASDVWHVLGLRADGDGFAISFNGKTLFAAKDGTFAGAGKIALWTKADSVTRFHALEVITLG